MLRELASGAAFLVAASLLWAGAHASRHRPGRLWAGAWASLVASSSILLGGVSSTAAAWVAFLGPVFPGGQLAGALALARGRAPLWVAPVTVSLCLLRVAAALSGTRWIVQWIGFGLEPAGTFAAALVVARVARREPELLSLRLLPAVLVAAALVDGLSAWEFSGGGLDPTTIAAWTVLLVVGLSLQLRVAVHGLVREQLERQQRTEMELQASRERFRTLCESAFDLVAELDENERFTYVNPRYEEALGYSRESFIGRRPAEFVHPDDRAAAARFAQKAARNGQAMGLVLRARHRDGHYLWLENVARSFVTSAGARRWVMNSHDTTDRKEQEERRERTRERLEETVTERTVALSASEARLLAIADQAPELISEFDDRGRYTFANAAFRDLLGLDPERLLGTEPTALIHPDDLAGSQGGMAHALRTQGSVQALHRLRHADGSWRWFDNTGRAYRTATGQLRFVSIGRDVTEARRAEAEHQRLQAHIQEVQRLESLGLLAGGIAHDFNNLLAVILGNAVLLEGEAGSESSIRLRRIRAAAQHAEALTDQMLAYAGKSVVELVPLDPAQLVRATEDLLRASVSMKCRLELDLEEGHAVLGDPTQLRQVLLNLVTNASEALSDDGGCVRVRVGRCLLEETDLLEAFGATEREPGTWVFLEVSDDGPGVDEASRQRIFEPFYTTKGSGRGLGLAAVLGIASAHRGLLKLDSAPGQGSVFRMLLPPCREARTAEPRSRHRARATSGAQVVLVVDDDEAVREVAQAFLERGGFRVETCAGGHEALARIRSDERVDAVLLDLAMPELSGDEVLRTLRAERPELPVVIASGFKRDLAAERIQEADRVAFVQKPYDPDGLVAALSEALRGTP